MRFWFAVLLAMAAALIAVPISARAPDGVRSDCHAPAALGEPIEAVVADRARWRCDGGEPSLVPAGAVLRFTQGPEQAARFFSTRPSRFDALSLAVVRDGKVLAQKHYPSSAIAAGPMPDRFIVALPTIPARGDVVIAVIYGPKARGNLSDARLFAGDPGHGHDAMRSFLIAAMVCGMMLMPLAFNAAYFRVLRERFVLWHLAVSMSLLVQCLLTSGIVGHFIDVPVPVYSAMVTISFGIGVAAAAAFGASFIEPRKLDPRLRKALFLAAGQVFIVCVIHGLVPDLLGPHQSKIYYASFLPVVILFCLVMADAWRRGSRAVRYQVIGWSPFLVMGLIRIATMFTPSLPQSEAMDLFYIAMVVESIATSLGVADRFMVIKRQRDRAMTRARSLERLSERDVLTGLCNRRALDGPVGDFARQRYTGFALFDLDNFKRVNDTHGHAIGDAVLRTVASVLDEHDDAIALRMGGEEFLLLLRGDRVSERVERLREAIPVRIAREVTQLQALVTSSAGLVEAAPGTDVGSDFVELYRAADDLLYEAKHNGRNLLAAITQASAAPPDAAVAVAA